jgi:UDP-N-acetylmuramate dehydrogenase
MREEADVPLSSLTTLRLGGPAKRLLDAMTEDELVEAVDGCDRDGEPVLLVGGGSNLVVSDAGFAGTVVRVHTRGIAAEVDDCSGATVRVAAGEDWDGLVARAVSDGIPGLTGATPVQNVGAYGQDVAQTIASVRVWDRRDRRRRTFAAADCGFAYRHSRFKAEPGRWVVLEVVFQLRPGDLGEPVRYAELARALGVGPGARAPLSAVRDAVLGLRRRKGMVLDAEDPDTWSAGSFFTNPVVDRDLLPADAPAWPQPDGRVKTSAAWLIERAGFTKGYGGPAASLSTKHTLALTNRGTASTEELLALAREVRDGVLHRFGIELVNEPVLVGVTL